MNKTKYDPHQIEKKWQKEWADLGIYNTDLTKENKFYVLAEFPYPSGDLHTGHWFTFCGADIFARYKRMSGFNVFFPNGFDAFGLPAENAAIKRDIHPMDWTLSNIDKMKLQFEAMGASFSFDHQVITCLPEYYKWNQWLFLKMLEKGLAYKGKYLSNWCNNCQTVLANEGVVAGLCWRCGNQVVQKEVDQWFFKITEYADRLIWANEPKVNWPKSIRDAQNDWVGRKEGINIEYKVEGNDQKIVVFTTRPETNFGATFVAIAPEHELALKITQEDRVEEVRSYIEKSKSKSELERKENKEKTGVFTGSYAINPLTGYKMPIWVSDFVLTNFGTGALVGVPGHDKRDFEFAQKFNLEIKRVVVGSDKSDTEITKIEQVQEGEGRIINSDFLDGLDTDAAVAKIISYIEENGWGIRIVMYHLHDWSVSRQRYWGTPIPIINCPKCGVVPVPYEQLPVELPYEVDYTPKGKPPLATNEAWLNVKCPKCGGEDAKREAETMDTFVDSSWYFFRYLDPKLDTAPFDPELAERIMPVDIYFGGAEHTLGHTLYSRFITKVFADLGLTDLDEYALKRVNHGTVLGPDGNRMSKSKGNVVNPDTEVAKYGVDAVRIFLAFFMPYEGTGPWVSDRIWGPYRFLERVWGLVEKVSDIEMSDEDLVALNSTVKQVGEDIQDIKFNTAISSLMKWLNHLSSKPNITNLELITILKLLSPFAPHITEEIWHNLGNLDSIHNQKWPEFDSNYIEGLIIKTVVQINGKVRGTVDIEKNKTQDKEYVEKIVRADKKLNGLISQEAVKNVVYIPGRIINFVIG